MSKETMRTGATFYLVMALVSAAIIFSGFAPSFYLKNVLHGPPPLSPLTLVHGIVFSTWMVLFIAQVALINAGNVALHRQLGILGAILFGLMVSVGYSTAITAGRLGHAPPPPAFAPLTFMAFSLIGLSAMLLLGALGLLYRRQFAWHARFMLAALFTMTAPGSGRLLVALGQPFDSSWITEQLCVVELLVATLIVRDVLTLKRLHPATIISASVVVLTHIGITWAMNSPAWMPVARWITRS